MEALAIILNVLLITAVAMNVLEYKKAVKTNKEATDAFDGAKQAFEEAKRVFDAPQRPQIHIVHCIHGQPEVKVVDMKKRAKVDKPETYSVVIHGKRYNENVRFESVVDAYHPYMAIGQAVAEFFAKPSISVIDDVILYQRVIKTIKPKQ